MAKSEPNPAQHLQWQPQSQPPTRQLPPPLEASKCRHVQYESSWRRVAWLLAVVCLLTRPVMPEVIYRVDPLGKCFVLFSLFSHFSYSDSYSYSYIARNRARNRTRTRHRTRDRARDRASASGRARAGAGAAVTCRNRVAFAFYLQQ